MLNALRHRWNHHVRSPPGGDWHTCMLCSTPCGINGTHHRRTATQTHRTRRLQCSTPCGINGIITLVVPLRVIATTSSAQRLAASMESSLIAISGWQSMVLMCSTPCGINGIITVTPGYSGSPLGNSAQRLAASMESSLLYLAEHIGPQHGAQRLAASMESSLRKPPDVIARDLQVLNALRHQ